MLTLTCLGQAVPAISEEKVNETKVAEAAIEAAGALVVDPI